MARSSAHDDDVLVIGLGRFGAAAALELRRLGHKVTAIEKDGFLAERFLGRVSHVVHGDASDVGVIRDAKAGRFPIAGGRHRILGRGLGARRRQPRRLRDPGHPGQGALPEHARILDRIGVQHIVRPEADTGRRVAHLVGGRMQDYIEFDDGFAIVKMRPPDRGDRFHVGAERDPQQVRRDDRRGQGPGEDFTYAVPSTKVSAHDTLIVSGPTALIERLAARP